MSSPTVPEGLTPVFYHRRRARSHLTGAHYEASPAVIRGAGDFIEPTGGSTICYLVDAGGRAVATGIALCREPEPDGEKCPAGDTFSKRLGRTIALGRACAALAGRPTVYGAVDPLYTPDSERATGPAAREAITGGDQ
jgi:hypothetical protein